MTQQVEDLSDRCEVCGSTIVAQILKMKPQQSTRRGIDLAIYLLGRCEAHRVDPSKIDHPNSTIEKII